MNYYVNRINWESKEPDKTNMEQLNKINLFIESIAPVQIEAVTYTNNQALFFESLVGFRAPKLSNVLLFRVIKTTTLHWKV